MLENPHAPLFENLALLEQLLWEAVSGHEGKDAAAVLGQALQLSASGRKPELRDIGKSLRERHALTVKALLETLEHEHLLEGDAVLQRTLGVRNPYVDPLNLLQVALLTKIRKEDNPVLRDAFSVTVNGIAAGLKNTG